MHGKFITFEGIDGSGKSTQLRMLVESLQSKGIDVLATFEPGDTPLGRSLRKAFLESEETVVPMAELLLFGADRAQHVEYLIKPALEAGKVVVSDRYADATFAYQGAGRGFDERTVMQVIELATGGLEPDLTLFFDITIETATKRMSTRDRTNTIENRMDRETSEFYTRVRDAYLAIAGREPDRFKIIDANGTADEIHLRVINIVTEFLESAQHAP